jgi:hypothetical protein
MTDIFFSYSRADRERVRPIRDALVAQGFEVFWDQEVPTGLDWDTWTRLGHLDTPTPRQVQVRNGVLVGDIGLVRQRPP